jgi:hypothetical protein
VDLFLEADLTGELVGRRLLLDDLKRVAGEATHGDEHFPAKNGSEVHDGAIGFTSRGDKKDELMMQPTGRSSSQ